MLGLLKPTDPRWVVAAEGDLEQLLSDHAHCELKAAHSALSLVGRFGGVAPSIVEPLLDLAREETGHFQRVHAHLDARDRPLGPPVRDHYVRELMRASRPEREDVPPLLDRLLVSALVEARSCERFKLLSEHLRDPELRAFYGELMRSEARHHRLFTRLAEELFGEARARARLELLAEREGELVERLPLGPTVHG